ncbi:MAG: hypothetical protein WCJ69_16765, partial [Betaproteobacteria bacterium]
MIRFVLAALLPVGLLGQAHGAERLHRYTVTLDSDLRALRAEACFAGRPPETLVVESLDAAGAFVEGKIASAPRKPLAPNGMELKLRDVPADGCIEYRVNLTGSQTRHDFSGNSTKRIGRDIFTEVGLWFWRPPQLGPEEDIEIAFMLPEGVSVSVPWRPVMPAGSIPTYRVGRGAYDRPSAVAFGHFSEIP